MIKRIGVLTSGGDSPGMNAAIKSIVQTGLDEGLEIYGIYNGYSGLLQNHMSKLNYCFVSDIMSRGGTLLGSARSPEFYKKYIRNIAIKNMKKCGLDVLIIIGGNGSYMGAQSLVKMGFPCIIIPGSIDNDVVGTDYTIGYFTALDTIVEAIDRLRDTSISHQRISIVEVMGNRCGDLTKSSAIACGCEFIISPEIAFKPKKLIYSLKYNFKYKKKHAVIVITEHICNVTNLAKYIEKETGYETRATILGHVQRGGKPVAYDRILASKMGVYSIKLLLNGYINRCIGIKNEKLVHHNILYALNNFRIQFQKKHIKNNKETYLIRKKIFTNTFR